jgi:hypothetical protein
MFVGFKGQRPYFCIGIPDTLYEDITGRTRPVHNSGFKSFDGSPAGDLTGKVTRGTAGNGK